MVDLQSNSNHLSERHVIRIEIYIKSKALPSEKCELAAALTSLKTTPAPVDSEFNSNRLSLRHVINFKIYIQSKALNCC